MQISRDEESWSEETTRGKLCGGSVCAVWCPLGLQDQCGWRRVSGWRESRRMGGQSREGQAIDHMELCGLL